MVISNRLLRHIADAARAAIVNKKRDIHQEYDAFLTATWVSAIAACIQNEGLELYVKDTTTGELTKLE